MTKEKLIIQGNSFLLSSRRRSGSRFWILNQVQNDRKQARYTLGEYSTRPLSSKFQIKKYKEKYRISKAKINKIKTFLKIIAWFPQIQLIGLSGTVAMMNAKEKDDIDIFTITAKNRLFTGRFIALFLAEILGIRRKRRSYVIPAFTLSGIEGKAGIQTKNRIPDQVEDDNYNNKVCLNLFMDELNLLVPKHKHTEYVAHEILQMKPLVQKDDIYVRFIDANRWVFDIFPNGRKDFRKSSYSRKLANNSWKSYIADKMELSLKKFQLHFIRRHQTKEIITSSQLWFHPQDFGKRMGKAFSQGCSRKHQDRVF